MRKAIFCINSGRVGSEYLAKLMDSGSNCIGLHEPEPQMINLFTRMVDIFPYDRTRKLRRKKAISVNKSVAGMNEQVDIYVETSNMFIKTFCDVIMDEIDNVEVIFLRRKLVQVVKSFVDLGYFLPEKKKAKRWLTYPNGKTAAIESIGPKKDLDQYDLVIAYLIDIEARGLRFINDYPQSRVYNVNVEQLNDHVYVERLFREIGIGITAETYQLLGQRCNIRDVKKVQKSPLEYCQHRIDLYLEKAKNLGIDIPETLYL